MPSPTSLAYRVVSLGNDKSALFYQTSGVPQGSNLGPLLFHIFINDIISDLRCGASIYADDAKLYSIIESMDDVVNLQSDLDRFATWCADKLLGLNAAKCKKLTFYRGRTPIDSRYMINGVTIESVVEWRDLGVVYDKD